MASSKKPLVLVCTTPIHGHTIPLRAVAKHLVTVGYEVTFISGSQYGEQIKAIGAKFVPYQGRADYSEETCWQDAPPPPTPGGLPLTEFVMRYFFAAKIKEQYQTIQEVLMDIRAEGEEREVVILCDHMCWGPLPGLMGANGLKPTGVIALGIVPLMLSDPDGNIPPFGLGLTPDWKEESHQRNKTLTKKVNEECFAGSQQEYLAQIKACGATVIPDVHVFDAQYLLPDRVLQMCVPSVEYPRNNLPKHLRFAGGLPKGARDASPKFPDFWNDIIANKEKKTIIAVSQGTLLAGEVHNLIIPTMEALNGFPSILLVVALGRTDAALPAGTVVPTNARIGGFVPFDELFPYCDVFVTNGGYGGFQHAIGHGVPMVIAGIQTDKPEVAARAEWAGVAIDLKTETPTQEAIRDAVVKILANPQYKERAKEIELEMESYNPLEIVVETIEELVAAKR